MCFALSQRSHIPHSRGTLCRFALHVGRAPSTCAHLQASLRVLGTLGAVIIKKCGPLQAHTLMSYLIPVDHNIRFSEMQAFFAVFH